jgi:hypothetical protein
MVKLLVLAIWSNLDSSHPCLNVNLGTLDGSGYQLTNHKISGDLDLAKPK